MSKTAGKLAVVDPDVLERRRGGGLGAGDDERHGVAEVAHLSARQDLLVAPDQPVEIRALHVAMREDGDHARERGGAPHVDSQDLGVGMGRAQHHGMKGPPGKEVLTVPRPPGCLVDCVDAAGPGPDDDGLHSRSLIAAAASSTACTIVL